MEDFKTDESSALGLNVGLQTLEEAAENLPPHPDEALDQKDQETDSSKPENSQQFPDQNDGENGAKTQEQTRPKSKLARREPVSPRLR